jgi:hypothetical protein
MNIFVSSRFVRRTATSVVSLLLLAPFVLGGRASAADGTPIASPISSAGPDCVQAYAAQGIGKPGDACVIFVHASADAPAIDVYVDGEKAVDNKPVSNSANLDQTMIPFAAGRHRVRVTMGGGAPDKAIIDTKLTFAAGKAYEVITYGAFAELKIKAFAADISPLAAGSARVRYINLDPASESVDAQFVPPGSSTGVKTLTIAKIKYGRASKYRELSGLAQTQAMFLATVPTGTDFATAVGKQIALFPGFTWSIVQIGQASGIYLYAVTRFMLSVTT